MEMNIWSQKPNTEPAQKDTVTELSRVLEYAVQQSVIMEDEDMAIEVRDMPNKLNHPAVEPIQNKNSGSTQQIIQHSAQKKSITKKNPANGQQESDDAGKPENQDAVSPSPPAKRKKTAHSTDSKNLNTPQVRIVYA